MDETEQLNAIAEQIGQRSRAELLKRFGKFTETDRLVAAAVLKQIRPALAQLIGENAKLKKLVAERSPGGYADAPVQYGGDE